MSLTNIQGALRANFRRAVPHVRELGIEVSICEPEYVEMMLPYREDWLGDVERGVIHTGVITTLVDSACGLALLAHLSTLEPIATLDLRMDYLRPAFAPKPVWCRAECYRSTENIVFMRASCWQDDRAQPVSATQAAFMRTTRSRPRPNMIPANEP
ncbi:MAG TPA: PaaI family thioesterase [Nevskiaceae bacterium]|nr:PaaI family thioesterase [Nevskiaceae bacterium]